MNSSENNWSLFLQSQIELFEGFNIVGGVRYDDYSLFGDATTWRVGVSYRIPHIKTLVHANIGTAFSPPSPQDVQPALYGNPLLAEPERSLGWEVGGCGCLNRDPGRGEPEAPTEHRESSHGLRLPPQRGTRICNHVYI